MSLGKSLPVLDRRARPLRDLRISVTDRCNFRCTYCMPRELFGTEHRFLPRAEILSFEEIARVARMFAALGARKLRLTGGEPLLRAQLPKLVAMLAAIPDVDIALTTNGSLLDRLAVPLREAGLGRVTVSLDSLDANVFHRMSDADVPLKKVLDGIEAANRAGLNPLKINTVVRRGVNEDGVVELAERFRGTGVVVRFIEFMDVGTTNGWERSAVVPAHEIIAKIAARFPLAPVEPADGGVARRYRYLDGRGEIGVIASVTQPFCGSCSRVRLSADGHLYTCLFAARGLDLRPILRAEGSSDAQLISALEGAWRARDDRYSELRAVAPAAEKVEMSYIGG